ncbi:hypothetical protein BDV34DRAFT_220720 [Aspergillus parasiticus]|uniref:Azaphilone pigments biosynthesis cluster protein L N-terminal domain-containing protein n=1 Tax=Aspergillus parasiticus TaxID=5067 RepID=A0A5N6DY05_ASPPA|nr:hypothetical protein BDV34DRAFT_220720 [Aspergillus parasiticus]
MNDRAKSIEETGHVQHSDIDLSIVREEKESTEQCLAIYTQVSSYIEGMQMHLPRDSQNVPMLTFKPASDNVFDSTKAYLATDAMLTDFKHKLSLNSRVLRARLSALDQQLNGCLEVGTVQSREGRARLDLIREERDSITQCLNICADASDIAGKARTNSFEDVTSADELAFFLHWLYSTIKIERYIITLNVVRINILKWFVGLFRCKSQRAQRSRA